MKLALKRIWISAAGLAGLLAPALTEANTVKVEMTAVETEVIIDGQGQKYAAWTFNNQFPGPVIRVRAGDQVDGKGVQRNRARIEHAPRDHTVRSDRLTPWTQSDRNNYVEAAPSL